MAIRKPKPPDTPHERAMAAWRKAARPPRSDPDGWCHEQLAALAGECGRDIDDLLDWWADRASIRTYDGELDLEIAERLAVDDVRDIALAQRRLLP